MCIRDRPNPASISIKGPAGADGQDGQDGAPGPAGPNEVSAATTTSFNGLLKGNGSAVAQAVVGEMCIRDRAEKGVTASEPADPKNVGQLLREHLATSGPKYQADKTAGRQKAELDKDAALNKQTAEADEQPADDKQAAAKKPQSREERAQHAARRREREQRQLAEQIREQERQRLAEEQDTFIASLKLTDPYTMAPRCV